MTGVKLKLLTDPNMLLMVEEGIRGGIRPVSYGYAKGNIKYMKNYDKNKRSSFLEYQDSNNLYGYPMTEKLPRSCFKWVTNAYRINKDYIKKYDEDSNKGFFLKVDIEYPEELHNLHIDLPLLPQNMKINGHNKLVCTQYDTKSILPT